MYVSLFLVSFISDGPPSLLASVPRVYGSRYNQGTLHRDPKQALACFEKAAVWFGVVPAAVVADDMFVDLTEPERQRFIKQSVCHIPG